MWDYLDDLTNADIRVVLAAFAAGLISGYLMRWAALS